MGRDEIIAMAREAGCIKEDWLEANTRFLERFATLVAAAEREACAQIVEREASQYAEPAWAFEIVNDIRARWQS